MAGLASVTFDRAWSEEERTHSGFQPGDIVDGKQARGVFVKFAAAVSAPSTVYVDASGNGSTASGTGSLVGYLNTAVAAGQYAIVQFEGITSAGKWIVPTVAS